MGNPIIIHGRRISNTWWGQRWCDNIDRYADWDNRLPRGRTYCRNGSIVDLNLFHQGKVIARVQGRERQPYIVNIEIAPLSVQDYLRLVGKCTNRFENVSDLLAGRFPEDLGDIFSEILFPSMKEIHYSCSCPDYASLCKHIASVLYGIGNRLDTDPGLIFSLRGIDIDLFTSIIVSNEADRLWDKASRSNKSRRVISDDELSFLFGVDDFPTVEIEEPKRKRTIDRAALRLDNQLFSYSDNTISASGYLLPSSFVLAPRSRIASKNTKAAKSIREKYKDAVDRFHYTTRPLEFSSPEAALAFVAGTENVSSSSWYTAFGMPLPEVIRLQAQLDAPFQKKAEPLPSTSQERREETAKAPVESNLQKKAEMSGRKLSATCSRYYVSGEDYSGVVERRGKRGIVLPGAILSNSISFSRVVALRAIHRASIDDRLHKTKNEIALGSVELAAAFIAGRAFRISELKPSNV